MAQPTLFDTAPARAHPHVPDACLSTWLVFKRTYGDEPVPRRDYMRWAQLVGQTEAIEQLAEMLACGCAVEGPEGVVFK